MATWSVSSPDPLEIFLPAPSGWPLMLGGEVGGGDFTEAGEEAVGERDEDAAGS